MNRRFELAISGVLAATVLACAAPAEKSDQAPAATGAAAGMLAEPSVAEIRSMIESTNQKLTTAMLAGDAAGMASYYADSVLVLMPGTPIMRGRMAYEQGLKGMMETMKITAANFRTGEVIASGDLAVETGSFTMSMLMKGTTKPMDDTGKYLTVWQRQSDGSWKVLRDINNSDIAPSGTK